MGKLIFLVAMLVVTISATQAQDKEVVAKDTLVTITKTTVNPDYKYQIAEQYTIKMLQVISNKMTDEKLQTDSITSVDATKKFIQDVQKALVDYQSVFVVNEPIDVNKTELKANIEKLEAWKTKIDNDKEIVNPVQNKLYVEKVRKLEELKQMEAAAEKSTDVKIVDKTEPLSLEDENTELKN